MFSKARIAGHPLHPMLVVFPIAFYLSTFVSLVGYALTLNPFWFRLSLVANLAGVASAVLAAIPGAVDYFTVVPKRTVARRTALVHALLNVGALILFAVHLVLLLRQFSAAEPPMLAVGLVLTGGGVLLTAASGFFGWDLVQRHHIGVSAVADLRTVSDTVTHRAIEEAAMESGAWAESSFATLATDDDSEELEADESGRITSQWDPSVESEHHPRH